MQRLADQRWPIFWPVGCCCCMDGCNVIDRKFHFGNEEICEYKQLDYHLEELRENAGDSVH